MGNRIDLGGRSRAEHGGKYTEEGKGHAEGFPFFSESLFDVVHRSAGYISVFINGTESDSQTAFRVFGRHTEEGGDPHPEESTRSAELNGSRYAHNISCAYSGGKSGTEGFEAVYISVTFISGEEDELEGPR